MDSASFQQKTLKRIKELHSREEERKPKVVVIMGPTGAGKSKLSIDLASHFPVEIINADSMQVYRGLDVLTNKVPLQDRNGVPHHLMGTVSSSVEFTVKEFRDSAIPIIDDILSRNRIPVIVGGTNYYIQALVSSFLLDDSAEDMDENCSTDLPGDEHTNSENDFGRNSLDHNYDVLKELDPAAANRIHPNNHRKINQYLSLYARSGVLPSKLYQGKAAEHWGHFRFNCCFICVDSASTVLDPHVEQRVDSMINSGLLHEVYDIYKVHADYTRGLRQAIGVREFEDFLKEYFTTVRNEDGSKSKDDKMLKEHMTATLNCSKDNKLKLRLEGAIDKMKMNTRRLVRCQKRRFNQLQTLFGWNIHYIDATESISSKSDEVWAAQVVVPAVDIIRTFLDEDERAMHHLEGSKSTPVKLIERDLWTQYVCQACGDRVLRGTHEWEQHKQGRRHKKRVSHLKKSQGFYIVEQHQQQQQQQQNPEID